MLTVAILSLFCAQMLCICHHYVAGRAGYYHA